MLKQRIDDGPVYLPDDILITSELCRRPSRARDYEAEARALEGLARELGSDPHRLLQGVVETARLLCRADSAGVGARVQGGPHGTFRWQAIAGPLAASVNGRPRQDFELAGGVIGRDEVLLLDRPQRALRGLPVAPVIPEALLATWQVAGQPEGALWAISHVPERHFDGEDARLLASLVRFAAVAWAATLAADALGVAETRQHRTEPWHDLILQSARDYAIITVDNDGLVESWSPGAEAVCGWTAEEMLGKPIAITFTPEDRAREVPERELAVARDEGVALDIRWHLRKDGQRVFIEGTTRPIRDHDGRLLGFLKMGQDVTRRLQSELALGESEARYRALAENVRDYAIFLLDAEGRIVEWSESAERLTGYTGAEVLGRHHSLLFTVKDVAAGEPARELGEATATGRAEREGWRMRRGGTRFWADEILSAVRAANGALLGFTKVSRDLTARHLATEASERVRAGTEQIALRRRLVLAEEKERRRLARELHDEAGQYLTALGLGLRGLADVALPGSDVDRRVTQLRLLADTLGRELHSLAIRLRPKALDDFGLEAALASYAEEWSRRFGITVDVHAGSHEDRLPAGVENAVYRIVQEALTNVARHSGASHVGVLVERRDGQVHAIIEDDGRGFDTSLASRPDGAEGLGLLGIHERTALLGGTMEIESAPGAGTTLFVRFPIDGPPDDGSAGGDDRLDLAGEAPAIRVRGLHHGALGE